MRHRNDPEGLAGRKLYLGGLLEDVRKEELTKELARFGPLDDVWIARNPPGFAFVVYQRDADAERCARALDGMNVCGSRIRVEFAHRLHKDAPPAGKFGGPTGRRRDGPERPGFSGRPRLDRRPLSPERRPRREPLSEGRFRRLSPRYDDDLPEQFAAAHRPRERFRSRSPPRRAYLSPDEFEPPPRRAPASDDLYDSQYPPERDRRRSPYSPPADTARVARFGSGPVVLPYRRDADDTCRSSFRQRDRSPPPQRQEPGPADDYAGYYGSQSPSGDEDREEDDYWPYGNPEPVRLGRPR